MKFRSTLYLLAALALALALAACAEGPAGTSRPSQRLALSQVTLEPEAARRMINGYRAGNGLKPLKLEAKLTLAARQHSQDLARHDRISHQGSDGSDPWARVSQTGYRARLAAENVGAGQRSFAEVLQGWKDSMEHNRNLLLGDATQMGIALATNPNSRYQTFWTLVLGNPASAAR